MPNDRQWVPVGPDGCWWVWIPEKLRGREYAATHEVLFSERTRRWIAFRGLSVTDREEAWFTTIGEAARWCMRAYASTAAYAP